MSFKKALFIRFGGLGDILLATPSLRAVHRAFPGIEIDFIVGGGMTDVLAGHPCVHRVITFDKRGVDSRIDHLLPFLAGLAKAGYDLVVNLHPSAKSMLMTAATGAPTRIIFKKNVLPDPGTGRVLHAIDDFAKELKPLGIAALSDRRLDFAVTGEALERVRRLVRAGSRKILVINAAASRPINRWPMERFVEVAGHFARRDDTVVALTGAPRSFHTVFDDIDEVALASQVAEVDAKIVNLAGCLSVPELGALLSISDAFLTCDTGPMHIGAAVTAPMVVLTGAADPDRTGHAEAGARILIDRSLPCAPCRQRACAFGDLRCMKALSSERVIRELSSLLYAGALREDRVAEPVGS